MTSVCSNRFLAGRTTSASRAVSVMSSSTTTRKSSARNASSTRPVSGFWGIGLPRSTQATLTGGSVSLGRSRPSRAVEIPTRTTPSGSAGGKNATGSLTSSNTAVWRLAYIQPAPDWPICPVSARRASMARIAWPLLV